MARKKTSSDNVDSTGFAAASLDHAEKLGQAFKAIISKEYGHHIAPKPIVTETGIRPLDAVLGGGFVSSAPIMISSTPETGKSTFAFQFSKMFQQKYQNGVAVYLDIEGSGNSSENEEFKISRIDTFGLDKNRFQYEPIIADVFTIFKLIESLCDIKDKFEEKTKTQFHILVIWDSIAATPCSKTDEAEDPNKMIGKKAREVTFCLEKYAPLLAHKRITLLTIDQVRANIAIDGPYAPKERSVGTFKDFKAASGIQALNHRLTQWIFMSKRKNIVPADGLGINGWYLDFYTEKNKNAPSKFSITCVFDKKNGIDKFWTEFTFLSESTYTEEKLFGGPSYPLMIKKSGAYYYLEVPNVETGEIGYTSDNFYKKNVKKIYETDQTFRQWFDYAVNVSVHKRIKEGWFVNTDAIKKLEELDASPTLNQCVDQDDNNETETDGDSNIFG